MEQGRKPADHRFFPLWLVEAGKGGVSAGIEKVYVAGPREKEVGTEAGGGLGGLPWSGQYGTSIQQAKRNAKPHRQKKRHHLS
jgi:hypothetical protein